MKVIETSTAERKQETRELFDKVKPFLDDGLSYNKALKQAGIMETGLSWRQRAYTRDVVELAKEHGY